MPASTWILGGLIAVGMGDVAALDLVIGPRALAPAPALANAPAPSAVAIEATAPLRVEVTSAEPAAPPPVVVEEDLSPVVVLFDTDRATLDGAATASLDEIAASLARNGTITVDVVGHADARGSEHHNQELSQRRMERVRAYLVAHGVAEARVRGRAAGDREPARAGTSPAALAANRRAEIRRIR